MTWLGDELGRIADGAPRRSLAVRAIEAHHRRRRNLIALAAAAMVVVVVLGGTAATRFGPDAARPAAPPPERAVIDVGVTDTVEAAPLYVALSKGFFAEEGLKVRPVPSYPLPSVHGLDAGKLDLAQTDYLTSFLAERTDVDVTIVGGLHRARPGSMALVVKAGSRIRSVAGLKGRKIAVPQLRGLPTLAAAAMLKRGGLDLTDVVLVESPYHHGVKNLDAGIAAAILAEPYLSAGLREGRVRVLEEPPAGFEGLPTAGWMAADGWIKDNPRTLQAFQRALAKAHRLIAADPGQAVRVLPSYARVSSSDLDGVELGSYSADLDVPGLQRLADLARRHSVLREPLDVRDFVIK